VYRQCQKLGSHELRPFTDNASAITLLPNAELHFFGKKYIITRVTMPYEGSRGKQCIVFGCSNSQRDVFKWKNSICDIHKEKHSDCFCLQPFRFHCLPKDECAKNAWLKAINRKDYNPASQSLVRYVNSIGNLTVFT